MARETRRHPPMQTQHQINREIAEITAVAFEPLAC